MEYLEFHLFWVNYVINFYITPDDYNGGKSPDPIPVISGSEFVNESGESPEACPPPRQCLGQRACCVLKPSIFSVILSVHKAPVFSTCVTA